MNRIKPPLLAHVTRDLAQFAASLDYGGISRAAIERMKCCVLDALGCCLFGATLLWTRIVQDMAEAEGAAPADA